MALSELQLSIVGGVGFRAAPTPEGARGGAVAAAWAWERAVVDSFKVLNRPST